MRVGIFNALAVTFTIGSMGCGNMTQNLDEERIAETQDALLRGVQQAKLLPKDPYPDGAFGWSVTIDGDTAAVSMRNAKPPPGESQYKGSVIIFERAGSTWSPSAVLQSTLEPEDDFGESIALSGDLLVVGTPYIFPAPGAVFAYVRNAGTWTLETQIIPQDGLGTRAFGGFVALSGNTLVVRDEESGSAGAAYVFVRNAGAWSQEARISWDEEPMGRIVLSNDTIVIGNYFKTRIFTRTGTIWSLQADLDRDWQTQSMAMAGDTLAFGGTNGVRIFSRNGTEWTKTADVWPQHHVGYPSFGAAMAMDGNRIVAGTAFPFGGSAGNGFVYTFGLIGNSWMEESRIEQDTVPNWSSSFGATLAISGDTVVIGAPDEDAGIGRSGAAYVYTLVPGLENGAACAKSSECAIGFCVDNVCCDVLCADTCSACSSVKKGNGVDGVCGPIALGTDPDAECLETTSNTCGTTGECNGAGACDVYAPGTECDDSDACTEDDVCGNGSCSGTPKQCALPDVCHLSGQCNVSTGECEYPLINPTDPACSPQPAACGCDVIGEGQNSLSWMIVGLSFLLRRRSATRRLKMR